MQCCFCLHGSLQKVLYYHDTGVRGKVEANTLCNCVRLPYVNAKICNMCGQQLKTQPLAQFVRVRNIGVGYKKICLNIKNSL